MAHYCTCCGEMTDRKGLPQDPNLDRGYGRCARCLPRLLESAMKHGFSGQRDRITDPAKRLAEYTKYFATHA